MPMLQRLVIVGFCLYCQVSAAEGRLNPKAHAHGVGQMTVLYEASQLLLELDIPAIHLLGFEHVPQTTGQWQQLGKLKKALNLTESTIKLQPHCQVQSVNVELPFYEEARGLEKGKLEEAHPEASHEVHQDIHLSYEWHCNGAPPPAIILILFHLYSGFDRIEVQWVANGKQGATTLDKNNARLEIQP